MESFHLFVSECEVISLVREWVWSLFISSSVGVESGLISLVREWVWSHFVSS